MKSFKVTFYITGKTGFIETVINAKTESDARTMVKAQYGSAFKSWGSVREIK